jgi:hypothetical protein
LFSVAHKQLRRFRQSDVLSGYLTKGFRGKYATFIPKLSSNWPQTEKPPRMMQSTSWRSRTFPFGVLPVGPLTFSCRHYYVVKDLYYTPNKKYFAHSKLKKGLLSGFKTMSDSGPDDEYNFKARRLTGDSRHNYAGSARGAREGYVQVPLDELIDIAVTVVAWKYPVKDKKSHKKGAVKWLFTFDVEFNGARKTIPGRKLVQTELNSLALIHKLSFPRRSGGVGGPVGQRASISRTHNRGSHLTSKAHELAVRSGVAEHEIAPEPPSATVFPSFSGLPHVTPHHAADQSLPTYMFQRSLAHNTSSFVGGLSLLAEMQPKLPCPRCHGKATKHCAVVITKRCKYLIFIVCSATNAVLQAFADRC